MEGGTFDNENPDLDYSVDHNHDDDDEQVVNTGKKGKELNGCHWLKIWLSDVSATTVAFFSKRWKMQMLIFTLIKNTLETIAHLVLSHIYYIF